MEILRVENICKTYEMDNAPVHALSDVSFSVDKGEFVAIIGASGSGKSTLLHILGGVDRPTSGKVFVALGQPGIGLGQIVHPAHLSAGGVHIVDAIEAQ